MRLKVILISFVLTNIGYVHAQNICAPYLEKEVKLTNVNDLWKDLAKVPNIKDEFETTKAFEDRVAAAIVLFKDPQIVEIPIDRKFITYDADTSKLSVESYAFKNLSTNYSEVFGYGTQFYGKIKFGYSSNIDIVFPYEEKNNGSYIGKNAMGAEISVTRLVRNTKVIFEREAAIGEGVLTSSKYPPHTPLLSYSNITPEIAKTVKTTARAAIVFVPKAPYFATGKFPWGEPTLKRPTEIDETLEVAIGDIQCALFLNAAGKVFGTVVTQ